MFNNQINKTFFLPLTTCLLLLVSCGIQKQISKSAQQLVIKDSSLLTAHVGISIYEPSTNKYWFNYQGDKYFVPASNTKLPTCYAAMKYLGDSLVGLRYEENSFMVKIIPTGDPTLLHSDYKKQPVYDFFINNAKGGYIILPALKKIWQEESWGNGWSWNDYNYSYMAERSPMPIYGNYLTVILRHDSARFYANDNNLNVIPSFFKNKFISPGLSSFKKFHFKRYIFENKFELINNDSEFRSQTIPFVTNNIYTTFALLNDTLSDIIYEKRKAEKRKQYLELKTEYISKLPNKSDFKPFMIFDEIYGIDNHEKSMGIIRSQPTDSLLKPMMHRSDNFFAEQTLLMVSNEMLGVMNDKKIIDSLLKTDFKDLPQKPRWVDGSGLSRYNLFTPQDLVFILNRMKNDFPMERIKEILPTGGEGTLSSYYKADSNYIFAKTGTLSGVVALSGYLYTKKNKLLIFSVLVNNHQASATAVRRAVEKFIQTIRNRN